MSFWQKMDSLISNEVDIYTIVGLCVKSHEVISHPLENSAKLKELSYMHVV